MSNYNSLKTTIDANIKQNGNQEITGQILNSVLNAMVTTLGTGYQFAGVATLDPATDPGTPDAKVFYIANGKGKYEKFGGINVTEDDVVVLYWDSSWHKVSTGIASQAKLSELETEVYGTFIDKTIPFSDFTTQDTGVVVAYESNYGTEINTIGWYCTDYIAIPDGITTIKYLGGVNAQTFGIAFYDENKSPNAPNPFSTDYLAKTDELTLSVPPGSRYFRASGKSGAHVKYSGQLEGDIHKIKKDITEINGTLVSHDGRIQSIEDELGKQFVIMKELGKTDLTSGYYQRTPEGKLTALIDPDNTGWSCLITEIMAGETVDIKTQGGNNAKGWYLCDGEKTVLSYAQSSGIINEHLTASVSGYIAVCTNNEYFDSFSVIIKKTLKELPERVADNETEIENLDGRVANIENKTEDIPTYDKFGLEVYGEEPPSVMKESPSFCSIVRTWGFIGDSFSSGYFDINNSTGGITDYDYSWCQMFARLNSALVAYNYAAGGMTAKSWCTELDGGTRRWNNGTGKILELKQAYVVQLGANDSNDSSLVAGDLSTDVDLNDYTNNADTFAGWIAGVIQRVKSINPRAFFFVATLRYIWSSEKRLAFSEVIRQLPTIFTNVYIVDIERYGPHFDEQYVKSKFLNGTHLSPIGNYYYAIMYNTIIDWIIARNMADFREIQFVGTDYHN